MIEPLPGIGISAVERDTRLSKDTLRVWERRYGFPQPLRDVFGERSYPQEQVDKLRVLRRLMDAGHRPGKIIHHSVQDLQQMALALAERPASSGNDASYEDLDATLALIRGQRIDDLRRALSQALLRRGLAAFVTDLVAPLTVMVGDAWARGALAVYEEHLYTEVIQGLLRGAIQTIPASRGTPHVLLTTLAQEPHGLGLLMAESLLALEGARCTSLGPQTPVRDVVQAANAQAADIVALSFSAASTTAQVIDGLCALREQLPADIQLWVGGSCAALARPLPASIRVLTDLRAIALALEQWREGQAPSRV